MLNCLCKPSGPPVFVCCLSHRDEPFVIYYYLPQTGVKPLTIVVSGVVCWDLSDPLCLIRSLNLHLPASFNLTCFLALTTHTHLSGSEIMHAQHDSMTRRSHGPLPYFLCPYCTIVPPNMHHHLPHMPYLIPPFAPPMPPIPPMPLMPPVPPVPPMPSVPLRRSPPPPPPPPPAPPPHWAPPPPPAHIHPAHPPIPLPPPGSVHPVPPPVPRVPRATAAHRRQRSS
ncbi:hypothetical protein BGW80DRAFT_675107 [Lactifluus volemus]|nr:hypothetical protein BGW80DRAFT_675107 [Lactifluus volemus]